MSFNLILIWTEVSEVEIGLIWAKLGLGEKNCFSKPAWVFGELSNSNLNSCFFRSSSFRTWVDSSFSLIFSISYLSPGDKLFKLKVIVLAVVSTVASTSSEVLVFFDKFL
nr:hypothetical protein [Mesomycoplasma ovipneumoniae]